MDDVPPLEPIHPKTESEWLVTSRNPSAADRVVLVFLRLSAEPQGPKSQKATVEEVEDEDAVPGAGKKKKKKKPKKKKKVTTQEDEAPPVPEPASPPPTRVKTPPPPPSPPPVSSPKQSPRKPTSVPKSPPGRSPSLKTSSSTTLPNMSTASLPFPLEQTSAQSAHSYVKDIDGPKAKVKSRSDHASIFSATSEKEKKRGFFSKFSRKDKPANDQDKKGDKGSWFSNLSKRTDKLMHQLLNTKENETKGLASMKWENFVKVTLVNICKMMSY
jgi:hypothetical protein